MIVTFGVCVEERCRFHLLADNCKTEMEQIDRLEESHPEVKASSFPILKWLSIWSFSGLYFTLLYFAMALEGAQRSNTCPLDYSQLIVSRKISNSLREPMEPGPSQNTTR